MQSSRWPILRRITDLECYKSRREGERLRRWEGIVCYSPETRSFLVAPIPLNLLLSWLRDIWLRMKQGRLEQDLYWAYSIGRQDGMAEKKRSDLLEELRLIVLRR